MATKKKVQEIETESVYGTEIAPEESHYRNVAPVVEPTGFYATADFVIEKLGIKVAQGERFQIPYGWQRDLAAEELRTAEKLKQGEGSSGLIFNYPGEIINPGEKEIEKRERRTHTVVLPLEVR